MAAIIGGAIGSSIPNIFGGFAPFPNTIATALLAYQSEAIGYGFGIKFQYSKRLIGAMTNEEFNALTPFTIGQIVESHNTELINRMKLEMPKWLDIQKDFIEASVQVEIAKAERTPSAWVEIIKAFTGAAGDEIISLIDGLDPVTKTALLLGNPLLALIYGIAKSGSGGTTEPDEPTPPIPDFEALPPHTADEIPFHDIPEHEESDKQQAIIDSQALHKSFPVTFLDPTAGSNRTWTTGLHNHAAHHTLLTTIQNGSIQDVNNIIGFGITTNGKVNLVAEYKKQIIARYLH